MCEVHKTSEEIKANEQSAAVVFRSNPIPLNEAQELLIKQFAADDRLWTTQESVEFNLRTFARFVLKASPPPPLTTALRQ